MLPKHFRLKRSRLFPKTMASGKILGQNGSMVVLALPRSYDSQTPTRFGFVVSKKVSNRANIRNKIRRRLREIVRTVLIPHEPGYFSPYISVVVIARKNILESTYAQLQQSLKQWAKIT